MQVHSFKQTRGSLDDLLPATSGPELDQILADLDGKVGELENCRAGLVPDISEDEIVL